MEEVLSDALLGHGVARQVLLVAVEVLPLVGVAEPSAPPELARTVLAVVGIAVGLA